MAGVVGVGALMVCLTSDPFLRVDPATVTIDGLRYTDPAEVRSRMGLTGPVRPATVTISTRSMEHTIAQLPTVASVKVRAVMPDQLTVDVVERAPMVDWRIGDDGWLVDVDGVAFAAASKASGDERGDGATGSALPAVDDQRAAASLELGATVDVMDLEAVRSLGAITPKMIHSSAPALYLTLEDQDGWVLTAPGHWRAVFGHYTRTLAPPGRIPLQVQCLRGLLDKDERTVDQVTLAVSADRCGTFVSGTPEPTPKARRTPRPTRTPRP